MNLNLGCGNDYRYEADWINFDIKPPCDICGNMEKSGLPFRRASFKSVFASHVLEHIRELRPLKLELARILKPLGKLNVIVPYYLSPDAWGDDTHYRAFSRQSFLDTFWPGFHLTNIELRHMTKAETGEPVHWIYADFIRTQELYKNVKSRVCIH